MTSASVHPSRTLTNPPHRRRPASTPMSTFRKGTRHPRRGGYLYITVLFCSLLIAMIVTAALIESTQIAATHARRHETHAARRLAISELERRVAAVRSNPTLLSSQSEDVWSSRTADPWSQTNPVGTLRHRWTTDSGVLTDDREKVTLDVQAVVGKARAAVSTQLVPEYERPSWFDNAIIVEGQLHVLTDDWLVSERPVLVGDTTFDGSGDWAVTTPEYRSTSTVTNGEQDRICGQIVTGSTPPSTATLVSRYVANSEPLDVSAFFSGSKLILDGQVINQTTNTLGTVDPSGVYRIDGSGLHVDIQNCRFEATLVIVNASVVHIKDGIVWDPPAGRTDLSLVTDADVNIDKLPEYSTALSPYPIELCAIRGGVLTTDEIKIKTDAGVPLRIWGKLLCGSMEIDGELLVTGASGWDPETSPNLSETQRRKLSPTGFRTERWVD